MAAHCALLRVLATPALRASDARRARLRHSLLHWGLRTGLRFAGPVFWGCGALRAVLAPSPLRGFDSYGLFRALRAAFVRFLNSAWSSRCAHKLACGTPCFIGLTSACFAHCARPSCAPRKILEMTYTPSFLIRTSFPEALSILWSGHTPAPHIANLVKRYCSANQSFTSSVMV